MNEKQETKKIEEMDELERMKALNMAHNIIHNCQEKIAQQNQNINNLMIFMEQLKNDTGIQDSVSKCDSDSNSETV